MGVGTYREMQAIAAGVDLFDCVTDSVSTTAFSAR